MTKYDDDVLRKKLIGLGQGSMRKTYYADLMKEKQKLEEQNAQLVDEIRQRVEAEAALKALNDVLETRIQERTAELEAMNSTLEVSLSELKRAQEYLVQTEKLAALGSLVAGISHEVNTPLGVCITSSTYLKKLIEEVKAHYNAGKLSRTHFDEICTDATQSLEMLYKNLERSAKLLENFKQIAMDQTHYEYRTFCLRDYTNKILLSLQSKLRKFDVKVEIECEESLEIRGYPGILTQILTQLVMNSLTHGFDRTNSYLIDIRYQVTDEMIIMTYSDNGFGMTEEQMARAFEPFFTTKRGNGCTGLGLFAMYNLVTSRLRGIIALKSQPGEGVQVTIELPIHHKMTSETIEEENQ